MLKRQTEEVVQKNEQLNRAKRCKAIMTQLTNDKELVSRTTLATNCTARKILQKM